MKKISSSAYFVITFLFVFLLGYWLLVMPLAKEAGQKITKLNNQGSFTTSQSSTKESSTQTSATVSQQTRELALLLLPKENKQYDLAVQIEGLAKSMGLSLTSMVMSDKAPDLGATTSTADNSTSTSSSTSGTSTSNGAVSNNAQKLTVTLGLNASYAKVQAFVKEVCRLNRMVEINQVSVTGPSDKVAAQIILSAFYLPL